MDNDKDSRSFGSYLKTIRLEKKISLEQVAEQTRVGLGNLLLLEQEDHDQLPAEVFVKGFLRSYAAAIGADGDEAVRRYEARLSVIQQIAHSEAGAGRSETRPWWKLTIILGLLLCIVAVSVMVISFLSQPSDSESPAQLTQEQTAEKGTGGIRPSDSESPAQLTPPVDQEIPAAGESPIDIGLSEGSEKKSAEKLSLHIEAVEDTWLKVIIDEKESTEYSLNSGDEIALEAAKGYNLLIGNAGGLKVTLNDKPVVIPGESGQVVTIHLP